MKSEILNISEIEKENEEYFISEQVVGPLWSKLNRSIDAVLKNFANHRPVKDLSHEVSPFSLFPFFTPELSVSLKRAGNIQARYEGNHLSHNLKIQTSIEGLESKIETILKIDQVTISSIIEVFFIVFEIKKKHAFWHGLYGLDYHLILTDEDMEEAMKEARGTTKLKLRQIITKGFKVIKSQNSYKVSCFTYHNGGTIVVKSLSMNENTIILEKDTVISPGFLISY